MKMWDRVRVVRGKYAGREGVLEFETPREWAWVSLDAGPDEEQPAPVCIATNDLEPTVKP